MKNFYFLATAMLLSMTLPAQTVIWSSDSSDYEDFTIVDLDQDGDNWGLYNISEGGAYTGMGFNPGVVFTSRSFDIENNMTLTPDNILILPFGAINVPLDAEIITFKMKVGASDPEYFEENFAVYVFDVEEGASLDNKIHEERLTAGNIAKDIQATIPSTFAGKSIGLLVRHYNSTDQNEILVDDFEVSYTNTLSNAGIEDLGVVSFYPNPVKDILKIEAKKSFAKVTIYNTLGQEIKVFQKSNTKDYSIDFSGFDKGIYLIDLESLHGESQFLRISKE